MIIVVLHTVYIKIVLFWWLLVVVFFFFCQTGAMKWLMRKSLSHLTTNLKRSHTFFRENGGPNFALINNRLSSIHKCCMKMSFNWWKWEECPSHPPILFMSVRWGAPHPPWFMHTSFRAFKRGPLKLWSSIWVQKNIFLPYAVPRIPKFLPPQYANAAKLIALPNLEDLFTVMAPSGTPSTPSFLWPPYLPSGCPME